MDNGRSVHMKYHCRAALPTLIVVNREGLVAGQSIGGLPHEALEEALTKAGL